MRLMRRILNAVRLGGRAKCTPFWSMARIENAAAGEPDAELLIYGIIDDVASWLGDGVSPKQFADDLTALGDVTHIRVRINSPGGDVFAAQAIYSLLKQHAAKITVTIDGWAASAASIIAMVGDEVIMPGNTMLMIHNPWTIALGDAEEMRKTADVLDQVRETIIAAYQEKSGMDREALISLINAETWMTAEEAKEKGFVDTVIAPVRVQACAAGIYAIGGVKADLKAMKVWPGALLALAVPEAEGDPQQEAGKPGSPEAGEAEPEPDPETAPEPEPEPEPDPVAEERGRISAILAMAGKAGIEAGHELVVKAIKEGLTGDQFAAEVVKSGVAKNAALLNARRNGSLAADVSVSGTGQDSPEAQRSSRAQKIADEMNKRNGFAGT